MYIFTLIQVLHRKTLAVTEWNLALLLIFIITTCTKTFIIY